MQNRLGSQSRGETPKDEVRIMLEDLLQVTESEIERIQQLRGYL